MNIKCVKKMLACFVSALIITLICADLCYTAVSADEALRIVRIPYGYNDFLTVDSDNNVSGFYADYFEKLAKINGWKYEYVETTWTDAVDMIANGEIDLLYPTNYSIERDGFMDFSSIPTGYISVGIFALENSDYSYNDYASFDGARIAYVKESSNAEALENFSKTHSFTFETVSCSTNSEIIDNLKSGKADLAIFNAASSFPGGLLVSVMDAQPVYLTVREGNTGLLDEINNGMQEILRNDPELASSTFRKTVIGDSDSVFALTAEERRIIDSGEEISVGFYEESEPLAYINKDGSYDGIYIELLSRLKEESGLNLVPYSISREKNWKDLIKSGEIDFYIGVSDIAVSQDEDLCITNSFMEYANLLVTRNDCEFNQIDIPVIAMTYGRANWTGSLEEMLHRQIEVKYYQSAKECMLAVAKGEADASLIDNMEFNYQIKNNRMTSLITWPYYRFATKVCMAASSDIDSVKLSTVNKALRLINADEMNTITDSYLNIGYHSFTLSDHIYNSRFLIIILGLGVSMAVIILVILKIFRKNQKKLREAALQREHEQLRILAALSGDYSAIYYTDLDKDSSVLIRISPESATRVVNDTAHSIILSNYIENRVAEDYRSTLRPLCDPKEIIKRFEKEKVFFIRYQIIPDESGRNCFEMHFVDASENDQTHRMVFGVRCIDEIIKAEQTQRQALKDALDNANLANAAKSEFLSRMSHDIRTPINAVIGMTQIAAAHSDEPERLLDALNKISSSSRYLLSLINDILDMSKIEAGKMSLMEENIDLPELLSDFVDIIRPQIRQHKHKLVIDTQNIRHRAVIGDSLRLQQVFVNFMSNAIKYTPDGGEISFTVNEKSVKTQSAGCYEFIFKDNGIGMSADFCDHIFEPFRRAEDLRTSKIQGTGLGLPITKSIVQMMNGSIEIESEPEKGSTFTVTIFLKFQPTDGKTPTEAPKPQAPEATDYPGRRILLAEDNYINCEIAKELLEMRKLTVDVAENGRIAVERFENSENGYYDMVLMDVQMPEMNGYEATREIRRLDRSDAASVPIIAVTANAFVEDIKASMAAGMNEHLSKPIEQAELIRILNKYLG